MTVTEPVDPEHTHRLGNMVHNDVNSNVQRFKRVSTEEAQGSDDKGDASEEVDEDAEDCDI